MQALAQGNLAGANLSEAERALLEYAELITRRAPEVKTADAEILRRHGWSDAQIAEAVYVIAMFAFFNRVAEAFGIEPMGYLKTGKLTP